jgi:HPt (histidine-containing phosphotransfer) domain-containing protein
MMMTRTPATIPASAPLDLKVIEMLRTFRTEGGPDPVADLTEMFVTDGDDRLRKLQQALAAGDEVGARRAAHSLMGMSGSLGAKRLNALSAKLEKADLSTIDRAQVQQLEEEFWRVADALKAS